MQKEFMVLSGRKKIVVLRISRKTWAKEKWQIAQRTAWFLRFIPTIEMVGVTGGLAMDNAKKEDDIDFLFIVAPGTIWISRFLAMVCVEMFSSRRRLKTQKVKNTICLNMFMTSDGVAIPHAERDIYTAHEVLQMKPLWERNGAYGRFLQKNSWVKKFLPNAWKEGTLSCHSGLDPGSSLLSKMDSRVPFETQGKRGNDRSIRIFILRFFEPLARILQLWYMKSHRTTEIIGDKVLRFHPKDARIWIKRALSIRLTRYKIPLDKIWYGQ